MGTGPNGLSFATKICAYSRLRKKAAVSAVFFRRASRDLVRAVSQHLASANSCVLIIPKNDLAVADGGLVSHSSLLEAWSAAGKIVDDVRLTLCYAVNIHDINIRPFANFERSPIFETQHARRFGSNSSDGFLNRVNARVAVPM